MKIASRTAAFLLTATLLLLTVGISVGEEPPPDFLLLEAKSGKNMTFKDVTTEKVNIMILTATNCVSCIKEIKSLDWIRAKYRGDVTVTAVFLDREGLPRVQRYLDFYKFDLDYFLIDESASLQSKFKADVVPTLIIFDRKGQLVFRKSAWADGDESKVIAQIDDILFKRPASSPAPDQATESAATARPASAAPSASQQQRTTGCASTPG